jgi:AcrR family transcriptional regulator
MQQRSEETRNRILLAAVSCFASHGYDVTSVAEICEDAGMSKGAFYHHFPTKQAVFLALMKSWLGGVDEKLRAVMNAAPNVPAGFANMSQLFGEVFNAAGGNLPMFLEFWTRPSGKW